MKTLLTLLIISITLISFNNCDFSSQKDEKDETIEDLTYELTSSLLAVSPDETTRQVNDERVKGKFLCQQACYGEIPGGYDECFNKFQECKESGQKKCGQLFRACTSEANVTAEDWDAFKTCKRDCRDTMTVCKDPFRECKSNCSADETCLDACKEEKNLCFQEEVCPAYPIFCDQETSCLEN